MSNEEADAYTERLEKKWSKDRKRDFVGQMERKLHHKERLNRR